MQHIRSSHTQPSLSHFTPTSHRSPSLPSHRLGAADAALNRETRGLADVDGESLGLPPHLTEQMPAAVEMMEMIENAVTPTAKLQCVETAVAVLTRDAGVAISADELIPLLSLLIIRSDVPNWNATLSYIEHLQLCRTIPEQQRYVDTNTRLFTHLDWSYDGGIASFFFLSFNCGYEFVPCPS